MTEAKQKTRHERRRRERAEREAAERAEVFAAIEKLEVGTDDVIVIRLADRYYENPALGRMVERVGNMIGQACNRPVLLLRHDQDVSTTKAPQLLRPRIALPTGVKVSDDLTRRL